MRLPWYIAAMSSRRPSHFSDSAMVSLLGHWNRVRSFPEIIELPINLEIMMIV